MNLTALFAAAGALAGTVIALTLELVPERLDLAGLVLTSAGLGTLAGSAYGLVRRVDSDRRARYAERGALRRGHRLRPVRAAVRAPGGILNP